MIGCDGRRVITITFYAGVLVPVPPHPLLTISTGLADGDADVEYFVTHLMANAESERTLCANIGTSSLHEVDRWRHSGF